MKNLFESLQSAGVEILSRDQQKKITGGSVRCWCPGAGVGTCEGTVCNSKNCGGRDDCTKETEQDS
jgi:hypothetical protein